MTPGRPALALAALTTALAFSTTTSAACRLAPQSPPTETVSALGGELSLKRVRTGRAPVGGRVTDIVSIRNTTGCPVTVAKRDGKVVEAQDEVITLAPNGHFRGSMWVPWADDYDVQNELWIAINGRFYFRIWQQSGTLRFSSSGTNWGRGVFKTAPPVPGLSAEGGPRQLYIATTSAGVPFFLLETPD